MKIKLLKHGENAYQVPAVLFSENSDDPFSIFNFKQLAGDAPCFTNIADLDSILETLCKLQASLGLNGIPKSFITIAAKHGNACGIGVSLKNPSESVNFALHGNVRAIWGGEIITNFAINDSLAKILKGGRKKWMLHVIAAPSINGSAVKILSSNRQRKLFANKALSSPCLRSGGYFIRQARGCFMVQTPADYILDFKKVKWTNKPKDDKSFIIAVLIAWSAAFTSFHGGNEIAFAKEGALVSIGGGPSTYDAVSTAVARAKEQGKNIKGAVFGADAFFPFIDVPEIIFRAGCLEGTVPGGGKRENDVVGYFKKNKMDVGIIPSKYRGFCRH